MFQCSKKDYEKELHLCDVDVPQGSCMAEITLNRNRNFLDLGMKDCYLSTPASPKFIQKCRNHSEILKCNEEFSGNAFLLKIYMCHLYVYMSSTRCPSQRNHGLVLPSLIHWSLLLILCHNYSFLNSNKYIYTYGVQIHCGTVPLILWNLILSLSSTWVFVLTMNPFLNQNLLSFLFTITIS